MTTKEKAEHMYQHFGKCEGHQCRECMHFRGYEYSKTYFKCKVFGDTGSQATDWGATLVACGLFNKETTLKNIWLADNRWFPHKKKEELQPETLFEEN